MSDIDQLVAPGILGLPDAASARTCACTRSDGTRVSPDGRWYPHVRRTARLEQEPKLWVGT